MPNETKQRQIALDAACAQIEKKFGKGSIMWLGAQNAQVDVASIPTGSLGLDAALGIHGLPRGRVVEIFGPEASGKTTMALHVIAEAQKQHGQAAFVDAEHAMDPEYAKRLGVNIDDLLISQPDSGEEALEIAELMTRSGAVDVLVIDSVAALVPRAELEGQMGDQHLGLQARLMSQALRKLAGIVSKSMTCLIFINQLREKIGVIFGNPETTPGGRALKFYTSVRLDIRSRGAITEGDKKIGTRVRVKVVKNKLAPPFRMAEFDIMYGRGISRTGEILDLGLEHGLIQKNGAWYSYGDNVQLGQGRENAKSFLEEDEKLRAEVEVGLRGAMGMDGDSQPQKPKGSEEPKKEKKAAGTAKRKRENL